jgi:7-cyano-7-deazaguanine synthase
MANLATKKGVESRDKAGIQIKAPIIELSKKQIIQKGLELGVDYSMTLSCYDPDRSGKPCGECDSCRIRIDGFAAAGITDPALA